MPADPPSPVEERGAALAAPGATPSRGGGLLDELRRRGVVRAVVAYALFAFAVLQVSEPLLHALRLPDAWLTGLVVLLGLGFPLTAALSWAFDLTRRGIVRTASPAPATPGAAPRSRAAFAGVTVLAAGLGALLSWLALRPSLPPPDADGRISVAVADFANETRDPDLDGLSVLLTTALEQSKALRVVTRGAMADTLRRLGQDQLDRIDEGLARRAGIEAGVRALLIASVRKLDDVYAIEMRAVDPRRDEYLFTVRERTTGKKGILDVIDRLSERTRERLREPAGAAGGGPVKVAETTTASLEAWQHYFEGLKEEEAMHLLPAVDAYRRAVAADPSFALAHYKVAYLGLLARIPAAERQAALEAAIRGKDRVPAKERLLIEAWSAQAAGRSDEAHGTYARAAAAYPLDKEVQYLAGVAYVLERRLPEARPWLERAVALDPTYWPALDELGDVLFFHGTREEFVAVIRRYLASSPPPGPKTSAMTAAEATLSGRPEEAVAATRRILELDQSSYWISSAAISYFAQGRFEEAEDRFRRLRTEAATPDARVQASIQLAMALNLQGRKREALRWVDELDSQGGAQPSTRPLLRFHLLMDDRDLGPCLQAGREYLRLVADEPVAWHSWAAWSMAYIRAWEDAAALAGHLKPEDGIQLYRAVAAWRRGDLAGSLEQLRAIYSDRNTPMRHVASWYLARVAFEAGAWSEAISAGEEAEIKVWSAWRGWGIPIVLLERARAWEQLGQRDKALAAVDQLLGWWKRADADLPRLAEARALRARLLAGAKGP